jgi:hypothetical protein
MEFILVVIAACGGIFGAAIGSLTAFIFTGVTGLIGFALMGAGIDFDFMGLVPFGIFFGPHISFAGGAAAAAYARKRGYLESGKDIVKPLMSLRKPDVLAVGGLMGALGYVVNFGVVSVMPGMIDTVALSVFIVAMIAKVAFGDLGMKEIFGVIPQETRSLGGRFSVHSPGMWVEYMNTGWEKILIAIGAGGISGYATYIMLQSEAMASASIYLGFVVSAASLIFLEMGLPIPVTHHITIGASYAVLMTGSIAWGFAGAVMGAFLGDFLAKTFYVYGDCHVDPPAMSIALNSFLLFAIFPAIGIYGLGDGVAYAIIGLGMLIAIVEKSVFPVKSVQAE